MKRNESDSRMFTALMGVTKKATPLIRKGGEITLESFADLLEYGGERFEPYEILKAADDKGLGTTVIALSIPALDLLLMERECEDNPDEFDYIDKQISLIKLMVTQYS